MASKQLFHFKITNESNRLFLSLTFRLANFYYYLMIKQKKELI